MGQRATQQTPNKFGKSFGGSIKSLAGGKGRTYFILEHRSNTSKFKIGQQSTFTSDYVEIGRDPKCALSFGKEEGTVSRKHAAILKEQGNYVLRNLSQTNPTFINNKPVAKQWYLKSGDEFQLSAEGPRLAFLVSQDNQVRSLSVTARLDSFRREALKPYKHGLMAILAVLLLSVAGLSYFLWQQKQANVQLAENLQEVKQTSQQKLDSVRQANQANQALIDQMKGRMTAMDNQVDDYRKKLDSLAQAGDNGSNGGTQAPPPGCSLEKYHPGVYYIQTERVVAEIEGETKTFDDYQWSGTGFILNSGKFVTARHVVEPWVYINKQNPEPLKLNLNVIANNFGKVTAYLKAYSPDGSSFSFTNHDCRMDISKDVRTQITDNENTEYNVRFASDSDTDWAVYDAGGSSELSMASAQSENLSAQDELHILGYPLGYGVSREEIVPSYSQCPVAQNGLQDGIIPVTGRSFDLGNSGGPVFYLSNSSECNYKVVGIVSAGIGESLGFIVPISAIE